MEASFGIGTLRSVDPLPVEHSSSRRRFATLPANTQGERMTNKIDLAKKFAVVTGGAQGIGRAIVERFLDSGAAVAIWDRDAKLAEKTAAEVKSRGRAEAVAVDVTKLAEVEAAHKRTVAAFGRIDILVNNAGIAGPNVTTWEYP